MFFVTRYKHPNLFPSEPAGIIHKSLIGPQPCCWIHIINIKFDYGRMIDYDTTGICKDCGYMWVWQGSNKL